MIPTLDISDAVIGHDTAGLVAELGTAMSQVGFLHIIGHGVAAELIDRAHDAIVHLSELPTSDRAALRRPRGLSRGIFEKCAADGHVLQSGFQFIPYDTLDDAESAGAVRGHPDYFVANVWPAGDVEFRQLWAEYSAVTRQLGRLLVELFAEALGADVGYFRQAFENDVTLYSANWYPPQPETGGAEVVLNGQHADSGVLTVLHQRGTYEGLQVLHRDGHWETVGIRPESFVINIGHLMSRWTNGAWPATMHRVLAGGHPTDCRSSVAMHFLPNIDELISPLPSTVGSAGPSYPAITTYEWQHEFMEQYVLATHDWRRHDPHEALQGD